MASYDMDNSPAPEDKVDDAKKISFRFCRECSNMLYPKEDKMNNTLMFACRTCQYSEEATASCIFRNMLKENVQETAGNVDDVAQDPTVRASESFQRDGTPMEDVQVEGEDIVPELCTLCGQEILCPICEGPSDSGVALEVDDPNGMNEEKGEEAARAEQRERHLSGVGYGAS